MFATTISSVAHITLSTYEVGVQVTLSQHFTFTDPYFDTDFTIYGLGKHVCIINIHTECMQGHTSLFEFLATGDLCTSQTAAQFDLDSFRTHTQGRSNRHFGSPFEVDTVFDLAGNGITHDHRIQLRTADFENVDLNIIFSSQFLQLFLDAVYFTTTFTDDDSGLGSMNGYDQFTQCTLDNNLGDSSFIDTCIQVSSDLVIFD